jgi:uncharacterized membrane protein
MKRLLLVWLGVLVLGAAAFGLCYHWSMRPVKAVAQTPEAELAWLRVEFQLSDEQFRRIEALHRSYDKLCMENCQQIVAANDRARRLVLANATTTPEIDAALREAAELQRECRREMLQHIYDVAAVLPPEKAARYRQLMAERVVQPGLPHPAGHAH